MKKLVFFLSVCLALTIHSQENKLLTQLHKYDDGIEQMKYVLNIPVDSIPEDGFSRLLKIKLNSDLNTLGDIFSFYADSDQFELSRKEQSILENRILYFAKWFFKNRQFAIVKSSGGYAPISGIRLDTIADKKVIVLLMGGDCLVSERDKRQDYIYELFSNKVRDLLSQ